MDRVCKKDCKKENGNCPVNAEDGLPAQCVGSWSENKYYLLERYLHSTCAARKKFANNCNAVFIDLFCGPGKCVIRDDGREIDGGGLRVIKLEKAPFNEYVFSDIDGENIEAFKKRIINNGRSIFKQGDSNEQVKNIVAYLKKSKYSKYHFAYIDPFAPSGLKFETLKELAQFQRMDMLIHFPIGAIKRNIDNWQDRTDTILDSFLGTTVWRDRVAEAKKKGNQMFTPWFWMFLNNSLKVLVIRKKG